VEAASKKQRCTRCGKRFKKGGLAYRIKAELLSHFDGHIRDSGESLAELVEKIERDMENVSEEQLEKQIYQKFDYIVCPACRDEIERFLQPPDKPEESK
jgi:DNA-directed RNA polymerase subunit RPC12/RpoP